MLAGFFVDILRVCSRHAAELNEANAVTAFVTDRAGQLTNALAFKVSWCVESSGSGLEVLLLERVSLDCGKHRNSASRCGLARVSRRPWLSRTTPFHASTHCSNT